MSLYWVPSAPFLIYFQVHLNFNLHSKYFLAMFKTWNVKSTHLVLSLARCDWWSGLAWWAAWPITVSSGLAIARYETCIQRVNRKSLHETHLPMLIYLFHQLLHKTTRETAIRSKGKLPKLFKGITSKLYEYLVCTGHRHWTSSYLFYL